MTASQFFRLFKSLFIQKHHTSPCGAMVARPATSLEVAGSSPVVGVDRCGLRPDRFDGRTLSFELFENQKEMWAYSVF